MLRYFLMNMKSRGSLFTILAVFCLSLPAHASGSSLLCRAIFTQPKIQTALDIKTTRQIDTYLTDTVNSLEHMRGRNGLLADIIWIESAENGSFHVQTLNPNTSPTNIAVDLLVQDELISYPQYRVQALKNISRALSTLENLDYHHDTGLIFSRYATDSTSAVKDSSVSAIDNLHFAIALYTIHHDFAGTLVGEQAGRLFERMNFSVYYNQNSGLIGGNLIYQNGKWIREAYEFANLGSEARSLYSAGWALGLFKDYQKNYQSNADFLPKAFAALGAEILHSKDGDILKLWDGSAFQMYFPKMFISEELYSPKLNKMYSALANYMIAEGKHRNLPVPAAHSTGVVTRTEAGESTSVVTFKDKAGNWALVSSDNLDIKIPLLKREWDSTFSPSAFFMAAISHPEKFIPVLNNMASLKSGADSLYLPTMGWMDGYQVKGKLKGQVVPGQLSLNQGMIALSLLQMRSADGLSASSRALYEDPNVNSRLRTFYQLLEEKLNGVTH